MKTINKYLNDSLYIKQKSGLYRVFFSKEDKKRIATMKWRVKTDGTSPYCVSEIIGKKIYLHRFIMSFPICGVVDHKNRNTLDNTRGNLRVVSRSTNNHNVSKSSKNPWPGVVKKSKNTWQVRTSTNGKEIYKGSFKNLRDAIYFKRSCDRSIHNL